LGNSGNYNEIVFLLLQHYTNTKASKKGINDALNIAIRQKNKALIPILVKLGGRVYKKKDVIIRKSYINRLSIYLTCILIISISIISLLKIFLIGIPKVELLKKLK